MANTTSKTYIKRLPKGQRAFVRRMKSEDRKAGIVYRPENHYGIAATVDTKVSAPIKE